jgi:hypothetical protein
MIDSDHKDAFWKAVADCLVTFHSLPTQQASEQCGSLRQQIESDPKLSSDECELIYHDDPFWLACQMAGKMLDVTKHEKTYDRILADHGVRMPE